MTTLTFKELLASPVPLEKTTFTLSDGREIELHSLPIRAMIKVNEISQMINEDKTKAPMKDIAAIAAQAVMGRIPKEKEVDEFIDIMGHKTVSQIYMQAVKFTNLGQEAIDVAKKD